MKYSQLKQVLQEVLTPDQKKKVDTWNKGDNSFSDHMFKDNEHRQSFELEDPRKSDHEDVVKSHIEPHGFSIKDYKSGTAIDKHGRETTIGKALNKVKAPPEVSTKFQNDPHRQQKGADGLHVSLSRHPHDVAGMTSKGHSWAEESCMNFCTGSNKEYLPNDVKHGTHIAYLTDKDDHDNSRPLARIALKKHTNIDDPNDHILVPEHRTYGNAPSTFEHTVHRILEKHQPNMDNGIYKKNRYIYDDTGSKYHIGKNKIDDALNYDKHKDKDLLNSALSSDHMTEHHMLKGIDDDNIRILAPHRIPMHKNATDKVIDKSIAHPTADIRHAVAKNVNLKPHHIEKLSNDTNFIVRHSLASNDLVKGDHLTKLLKDENSEVRSGAIANPNLEKHHLDIAIKDSNEYNRKAAYLNHKLTPEQVSNGLKDDSNHIRRQVLSHHNMPKEHLDAAVNSGDAHLIHSVLSNKNATDEHMHKAIDLNEEYLDHAVLSHKNSKREHIDRIMNRTKNQLSFHLTSLIARHPEASKEHLQQIKFSHKEAERRLKKKEYKD